MPRVEVEFRAAARQRDRITVDAAMGLTYADKNTIRGMLADKQSVKTIAEQYEVSQEEIQALARPKAVSAAPRGSHLCPRQPSRLARAASAPVRPGTTVPPRPRPPCARR